MLKYFIVSKNFTVSNDVIMSNDLIMSNDFIMSNGFIKSNNFFMSNDFALSCDFKRWDNYMVWNHNKWHFLHELTCFWHDWNVSAEIDRLTCFNMNWSVFNMNHCNGIPWLLQNSSFVTEFQSYYGITLLLWKP